VARLLVIDDDPAVRSVLGRMLQRAGHEVLQVGDAAAGLGLLRSWSVDLVIVDIYMRGLGGLDTIPLVRKNWPALKIIAISGADRAGPLDVAARATAGGANAFLKKPFDAAELLRVIGTLLPEPPTPSTASAT